MFIYPAFADDTASVAAGGGNPIMSILPILLILVVFYFMVIRPQSTRIRAHSEMVKGLHKGDKVVTGGGIVATVVKLVGDEDVVLKLADGVEVTAVRSTIMSKRNTEQKK
jgi:preprotein translocase subunit YajC